MLASGSAWDLCLMIYVHTHRYMYAQCTHKHVHTYKSVHRHTEEEARSADWYCLQVFWTKESTTATYCAGDKREDCTYGAGWIVLNFLEARVCLVDISTVERGGSVPCAKWGKRFHFTVHFRLLLAIVFPPRANMTSVPVLQEIQGSVLGAITISDHRKSLAKQGGITFYENAK